MRESMFNDPIRRVRYIGMAEAVSFLVLLGVAMPLKYAMGMPLAVRIVGMAHGVLFVALGVAAAAAIGHRGFSTRQAALVMGASLIPFGPFLIDKRLRALDESARTATR